MTKILKRPLSILLAVLMVMSVFIALPLTASAECYPVDGQNYSSLEYNTSGTVSKITCHFSYDDTVNIRNQSDKNSRSYNMIFTTTEPSSLTTEGKNAKTKENPWASLIYWLDLKNSIYSASTAVGVNGVTYSNPRTSSGSCNVSGTYTLTDTTTLNKLVSGRTYYGLLCSTNTYGVWYTSTYVKIVYAENPVAYIRRGNVSSYFTTLDNAIQNAQSGDTIVLLKNCTLNSSSNFSENKTIDLNGKYINITGSLGANNKIKIKDSSNYSRGVFTNSGNINYNNAARFTSAQSGYSVIKNSSGQLTFISKYTAIFKVKNGAWNDGSTADKMVTITSSDHKIGNNIPSVGNMPNTGYKKSGSWDPTLTTGTTINDVTTYTYTYEAKGSQTIQANNVSATYGDTDKSVSANVTSPLTGGGAISYAVKSGSETYINVDSSSGALTIKQVPPSGKAYVTVTAAETDNYNKATKEVTVTIAKATPTVTAPTANDLTYNAQPQELVTQGSTTAGTLLYSLDGVNYSASVPTATNAGTYTVYYKVQGNSNYSDLAAQTVEVTIKKRDINYGDDNKISQDDTVAVSASDTGAEKFGLNLPQYLNMQMLGIQKKSAIATQGGDDGIRFVTVVNSNLLKGSNIEDYGYIVVKAKEGTSAADIYSKMDNLTYDKVANSPKNFFSCKATSNTISGEFGKYASNTDYKYVTLSLTGTSSSTDTVAARFYVKTKDGKFYYADYIDGNDVTHGGMAFTLPIVSDSLV